MKHRIALVVTLLAAIVAVFGVSATAAQAAPRQYDVLNGLGYCMDDPGVNQIVHVLSHCDADFTFTNPARGPFGHTYYLMRINGGTDCLNWAPNRGGFVYDNGCNPRNHDELWAHYPYSIDPAYDIILNYASRYALWACNPTNNSRLFATQFIPQGCHIGNQGSVEWKFRAS